MEHPTHCIGSACVLPDGCRFLRNHSEIIEQKRLCAPVFATVGAIELTKSSERARHVRGRGASARAATGIRRATEQGAAWDSLRYGTGRCLELAASRNRALPEICYATERGTKSTAASAGYGAATSIGRDLEGCGEWQILAGRWSSSPRRDQALRRVREHGPYGRSSLHKGQAHQRMARFARRA